MKASLEGRTLEQAHANNPSANSWRVTSTNRAPSARESGTAIWTGTQMIVWGGDGAASSGLTFPTVGGRYNPLANSWSPTIAAGAPIGRYSHTAVWTGLSMIVWGGRGPFNVALGNGGIYTP